MREELVAVNRAVGHVLAQAVRQDKKTLLPRGHLLTEADIPILQAAGIVEVHVLAVEPGLSAIGEAEAALSAARALGSGSIEVRAAAGGRANLFATQASCILADRELLHRINTSSGLVAATVPHFSYAAAGQRIATVKTAPFFVTRQAVDEFLAALQNSGPAVRALPLLSTELAVVFCDKESGGRARELFEPVLTRRLERFGARLQPSIWVSEEESALAQALKTLLDTNPAGILIASSTAPSGPDDAVGHAMLAAGCAIERFLAPVDPGNLLLLGYRGSTAVLAAPGCYRSARANLLDLILAPVLARHPITADDIAGLGHGGLLSSLF